uniref:Uncharacterized protein n=1 Tax=Tetranychus urticae TaxID=32264 RepID=T1JWY0_TETUR
MDDDGCTLASLREVHSVLFNHCDNLLACGSLASTVYERTFFHKHLPLYHNQYSEFFCEHTVNFCFIHFVIHI